MSRKTSTVLLCINGVLLAAALSINYLIEPPRVEESGVPMARTGAVVGQVEVRKKTSNRWSPAEVGQVLAEGDAIRTGLFSEAVLHLRGRSSVVISANTDFVVGQDLIQRSSFELGVGHIKAAIPRGGDRAYEFRSRGSDAVAWSEQGEFSMSSDGEGTVVVDSHQGEVKLAADGEEVVVRRGRRSMVLPDKPPSQVLPIPSSVALRVKWPATKLDKTRTTVQGKTSAGAMVLVNGILVRADAQGRFQLDIPLREGTNRLVVSASDNAGNTASRSSPEILVDTQPPDVEVDAKDLWK